ncbi:hypothetical protein GcM3_116017, partial [Golovinomyces cichoracearum]
TLNQGSIPLEFPNVPQYQKPIKELEYLTIVPNQSTYEEAEQGSPPMYEMTVYNRHRLNDAKAKDAAARELIREQRMSYSQLRIFTHRQYSKSSQRFTLNARLHYLKGLEFPTKYDQQLIRLDEWFDLAKRCQAADHPTYTGYTIIEDLLLSIRSFNESIFQTHYDQMLQQERGEVPPDFKNLIDELKQKLCENGTTIPSRSPISRSTFATLQGASHETAINNDDQKDNFKSVHVDEDVVLAGLDAII